MGHFFSAEGHTGSDSGPASPSNHTPQSTSHNLASSSSPFTNPTSPSTKSVTPHVFYVPIKGFHSLDLVSTPLTPEMEVKQALLSDDPAKRVISLAGGVGTGKTNILCALGRDGDVMNAFSDGVWFFDLRCDVNHSSEEAFQSFLNQMNLFVKKISPDLSADFRDITPTEHQQYTSQLMDPLMTKKVLLLFDDLSPDNEIVYDMVRHMASAVLFNRNSSLKILVSSRNSEFAQVQPNISFVQIHPQDYTTERNRRILCNSAGLQTCDIASLSAPNDALNKIVEKCGGLALALRNAGCGVRRMMGRSVGASMENAFVQYCERLEDDSSVLWRGRSVDGHEGLSKGMESSLASRQKTWPKERISVEDMFTSFCVVHEKEEYIPVGVIMKLWNVNEKIAHNSMEMFEENGVASLVWENGEIVGIKIADLMREVSVDMAERRESVMLWHTRIIDGYRASTNRSGNGGGGVEDGANESSNERSRWVNLDKNDKYIIDNIVWHLLGAGHENEVLRLVTEYEWIEKMNEDERRPAFEKIRSEFEMLREHLKTQGKTEADRRVVIEIDAVLEIIEACAEYCHENRRECTFQLYGRLCCVEPAYSLVKRIIWSIERDAECPWARAGPGVLMSEASSELKSVLQLDEDALCVSAGAVEEEVIVGGRNGKLRVLKKWDGSVKKSLIGHDEEHDVVCVSVDKKSGEVYSCTSRGSVIVWNEYRREQEFQVKELEEEKEEWITCMGLLQQARHVVVGTSEGRLLIMNASGDTIRSVNAHVRSVRSVATGNNVLVSASFDGTIRVSNPRDMSDEGIVMNGHTSLVNSVALNDDETLVASGSYDGTVRLWNALNVQESVKLVHEQHGSVTSVLFSADKQRLYSGDINGTICVWQMINSGRDLSATGHDRLFLARLLRHAVMSSIESMHINNDSELLVVSNNQVFVWNTTECGKVPHETNLYLPDVRIFGFSPDENTISTWSPNSGDRCIKVRNIVDVYRHSDHFVSSFKIADSHDPFKLTVSNDQKMVAYADRTTSNVIVGDTHSGAQLHTLYSVHQWAFSSTPKNPKNSSQQCGFESLYFSSDGGIVTAVAVTKQNEFNSIKSRKLFRWHLSSGTMIEDDLLVGDRADHPDHSSLPLLFCKELTDKSKRKVSNNIVYKQNDTVFNIATIEHNVECEHYSFNTSRLWVSRDEGGLKYIDLVSNNSEISSCHQPALPILSQPYPLASNLTDKATVTDPVAQTISAPPIKSTPGLSLPSPKAPLPHSTPQTQIPKPRAFYVPHNPRAVIDMLPSSKTPESFVKSALLSNDPSKNAVVLVGMGGVGKTTILRALGRDKDIWTNFKDGVWFFEIGQDVTLSSFIRQLQTFIKDAFPEFSDEFNDLTADEGVHNTRVTQLMDQLQTKDILLLFDDVWDVNKSVYKLVYSMCIAVQDDENSSLKLLTSTRSAEIADIPAHQVCIELSPADFDARREEIFCCYAGIDKSDLSSFSHRNRESIQTIITSCGSLPLALSIAGSAVKQHMDLSTDQKTIPLDSERLEMMKRQLTGAESGDRHKGLVDALKMSLEFLDDRRESTKVLEELPDDMSIGKMFRSFCIMQKQMHLPIGVLKKLWGVENVQSGVQLLSRYSLISESKVRKKEKWWKGVSVHDLVLDTCLKMAESRGEVKMWHEKLLDAYRLPTDTAAITSTSDKNNIDFWLDLNKDDYMIDNVVRHLLDAGRRTDVLELLFDYRWVEKMNQDKEKPPFQKIVTELMLLREYLDKQKTEEDRRLIHDIDVVVRTMELCMPYCMRNRAECTFQIFGRLRGSKSNCGVVEKLLWSIERHAQRPWARAEPGVLTNGNSLLKRMLPLNRRATCMSVGTGDDVVLGGAQLWVVNGRDGSEKKCLVDDKEDHIRDVFADRNSGWIYSVSEKGNITFCKEYTKRRHWHVEGLVEKEWIWCMLVLRTLRRIVLGTQKGRLLLVDMETERTIQTIDAHASSVVSLAAGEHDDVLASASWDGKIHVWNTATFEDTAIVMEGHSGRLYSLALSGEGNLLASGSDDQTLRLWNVKTGKQVWKSSEHSNLVKCVAFSRDGRVLYSVNSNPTYVHVWRVDNGGRDVFLVHTLRDIKMTDALSIWVEDLELFMLFRNQIYVWDARDVTRSHVQVDPFLSQVRYFGISEGGTSMVTYNEGSRCIEVRDIRDVSQHIDRVISSLSLHTLLEVKLAVTDDHQLVAYSGRKDDQCVVHIVKTLNGDVFHTLYDLQKWVMLEAAQDADLEVLCFSSHDSAVSAVAAARWYPEGTANSQPVTTRKSISWNLLSGEPLEEPILNRDIEAPDNTANPRLFCKHSELWPNCHVEYEHDNLSSTIATLEYDFNSAHYCSQTSRLWISREFGGVQHVDLITEDTEFPPCNEPPLPLLSHAPAPPSQDTITDTDSDEVYDVYISHAGTDKFSIALPLYNLLVALGFKVFLDWAELRSGVNGAEKMIKAMRTAKIAVVILSPEFAARKWTLKELMCFLERYEKGGEREVVIIPVFYRLTLNDCRNEGTLFSLVDEKNKSVFMKEGFLQRMAGEKEYGIGDVLKALQSLRSITGIENKNGVTNGKSEGEKAGQRRFVEEIVEAIVEAKKRVDSGGGAGPSGAEV